MCILAMKLDLLKGKILTDHYLSVKFSPYQSTALYSSQLLLKVYFDSSQCQTISVIKVPQYSKNFDGKNLWHINIHNIFGGEDVGELSIYTKQIN